MVWGGGGGYPYSNMTNYFKVNNYHKFYSKTVIVTTAIMSNNSKLYPCYADFTHEIFPGLTNQNRGHSNLMLEYHLTFTDVQYCSTDGNETLIYHAYLIAYTFYETIFLASFNCETAPVCLN